MRTMVIASVMGVMVMAMLAACGKADRSGGGSDPKTVVKGFAEAMIARDFDKAATYLMGAEACELAPAEQKERCEKDMKRQREALPELAEDTPKNATVKSVEKYEDDGEAGMPPGVSEWKVILLVDGKEVEDGAMTMEYKGKHYVALALRKEEGDEK